jgi:hypothetical protein
VHWSVRPFEIYQHELIDQQILDHTHVNLIDLVDSRRTRRTIDTFPNIVELAEYTMDTGKYFPREHAQAGGLLQRLLRRIMYYGTNFRAATFEERQACQ